MAAEGITRDWTIIIGRRLLDQAQLTLLVPPGPAVSDLERRAKQVRALQCAFEGYEGAIKALSSSNRGYEFRDLSSEEKDVYDHLKHAMLTLDKIYVEPTRPLAP